MTRLRLAPIAGQDGAVVVVVHLVSGCRIEAECGRAFLEDGLGEARGVGAQEVVGHRADRDLDMVAPDQVAQRVIAHHSHVAHRLQLRVYLRELGALPVEELKKWRGTASARLLAEIKECNGKLEKYSHVNKKALDQYVNFADKRERLFARRTECGQGKKEIAKLIASLDRKKDEFRQRMQRCQEKEVELAAKQEGLKEQVRKFDKFLKENDAKRVRANRKAMEEVKLRDQKDRDLQELLVPYRVDSGDEHVRGRDAMTLDLYRRHLAIDRHPLPV